MAYAKLVFPSGTYALKKLKEIARFATGQISSVSSLEFANQSLSEIVVIDEPGWSLQSQTFETTGVATQNGYRLTAPCVNTSKNKCVYMDTYVERGYSNLTTAWTYTTRPSSTATAGNVILRLGSSWSGTTLNNITSRPNQFNGYHASGIPFNTVEHAYFMGTSLADTTIYIFCSSRKLIIFAPEASGRCDYTSVLEFPETVHTSRHNNVPAVVSAVRYASSDSPYKFSSIADTTSTSVGNGAQYNYYYIHQLTNWYNPTLNTRAMRGLYDWGTNNIEFFSTPNMNITSSGQAAYPLIPIVDIRTIYGEGIHNYSELTKMYITYRDASYAGHGDTLSVDGMDYSIVQVGDSTSNYRAFAIKKG